MAREPERTIGVENVSPFTAGTAMAFSAALEQAFLSKEFSRPAPSRVRLIGTLLDSAFSEPAQDDALEALLRELDRATRH